MASATSAPKKAPSIRLASSPGFAGFAGLGRRQSFPSSSILNQSSNGSCGTWTSAWKEPSTSTCAQREPYL